MEPDEMGRRGLTLRPAGLIPIAVVAIETVLVATLGMTRLGDRSLWLDEAISVRISQLDLPIFWQTVSGSEAMMPL